VNLEYLGLLENEFAVPPVLQLPKLKVCLLDREWGSLEFRQSGLVAVGSVKLGDHQYSPTGSSPYAMTPLTPVPPSWTPRSALPVGSPSDFSLAGSPSYLSSSETHEDGSYSRHAKSPMGDIHESESGGTRKSPLLEKHEPAQKIHQV
jgi:hypothetical protein